MILIPCPLILVERAAGTTITSNKTQDTQICWHESNSTQECSWYIETTVSVDRSDPLLFVTDKFIFFRSSDINTVTERMEKLETKLPASA